MDFRFPEPLTKEHLAIAEFSSAEGNPESRVKMWLSGTITSWVERRSLSLQMFNANTGAPSDTSFGRAMILYALTDVTNLRSSGYLEHNRFARSSKKASESKILTGESSLNEVSGPG